MKMPPKYRVDGNKVFELHDEVWFWIGNLEELTLEEFIEIYKEGAY